ncbi:MAG TPA: creatininase family protein [Capillimicrobium sp.]|jgi:creatinine amidohydrolase
MTGAARRLGDRTSPEIAAADRPLVIVPVGAVEQHGPHLPLDTDTILASAVAEGAAARVDGALLGPTLGVGCSSHHLAFPGTVSLDAPTFVALVVDVCRSLHRSAGAILLLNGHGGNRPPLGVAAGQLADEGIRVLTLTYWELLEDVVDDALGDDAPTACGHACALETSLMQFLEPGSVREGLIPPGATPPTRPDPHMFSKDPVRVVRPFEEISPDGVIGRPSLASAELGQRLYEAAVERTAAETRRLLGGDA